MPSHALLYLLPLLFLTLVSCDTLGLPALPAPVPTFADSTEAAEYLIQRANLVVIKGQRITMLAMASGQGSCSTKIASTAADVSELEQAFFSTPEGQAYRQLSFNLPADKRAALKAYVDQHGAKPLATHINKQISYLDSAINTCE